MFAMTASLDMLFQIAVRTENPKNTYSKPLNCGYSPYANRGEEWSTNPLKQKAIKHYEMQELVKKND